MSEPRVFIPWMHAVGDDYDSEGVWVTASEVRDVLTTSHMHCGWEVSRGGEAQPCRKTAVAIRYDEENGVLGEVCKAHAARVLVPLSFIAQTAAEVRSTDTTKDPRERAEYLAASNADAAMGDWRPANETGEDG